MECCFTCEHCDAIETGDDMNLCCMLAGEENPVEVRPDYICKDYNASIFADVILVDAETLRRSYENAKPKLKPIPEFLKACGTGRVV